MQVGCVLLKRMPTPIRQDSHSIYDFSNLFRTSEIALFPYPFTNQSILKEISPEYSSEGLMLKLKLQCFGHFMGRTDSLEKTLMLEKIEGERRRG